jgi:hypothetical protein
VIAAARVALLAFVVACGAHGAGEGPGARKLIDLNTDGAPVDIDAALVDDYVTVVDFWSESCGACVIVGGRLAIGIADQPRVLVRKVDVGDGFTPAARAYQIGALPHFNIYDRHKKLRYVLVGNDCLKAPELARALVAEP